jgi:hypothetical protein
LSPLVVFPLVVVPLPPAALRFILIFLHFTFFISTFLLLSLDLSLLSSFPYD